MKNKLKLFPLVFIYFLLMGTYANAAMVYEQAPISWSHHCNSDYYSCLIADDF